MLSICWGWYPVSYAQYMLGLVPRELYVSALFQIRTFKRKSKTSQYSFSKNKCVIKPKSKSKLVAKKRKKCLESLTFYLFFQTRLINLIIQERTNIRFYLSYDIMITLKSHFSHKKRYNFVIMYVTLLWTS